MPLRRRPTHISAAALPASRLPLGTPTFSGISGTSPATARTSSRSPPQLRSQISNSSLGKDNIIDTGQGTTSSTESINMAPKNTSDPGLAKSIAEAKLERQRKRIEEADNPLPRKNAPRGKAKQWKPFDFTADTPKGTDDGGVPVSEVRVNTFRALSREGLSRESSSVRSASVETGLSERERPDSALTDHGFQVFTGRRSRKNVGELNAYEDKPEERQTTVEATFDKREIYEVFGNALPGPEFIQETVGLKDGHVQFIQHPNGDVSSQQWCQKRYMWENIGQFSNIRKKVEGQLASDRLKGETAHQTLQQNTLAYFRTIAKQREANAMGLPFGAKEIQAAMPHPRPNELAAAPTGLKETTKDKIPSEMRQATEPDTVANPLGDPVDAAAGSRLKPPGQPFLPERMYYGPTHGQQPVNDDPFYSCTFQQIYGSNPYMYQTNPFLGIAQRSQAQALNYDFHFPPAGNQATAVPGQRYPQFHTPAIYNHIAFNNPSDMYGTPASEIEAPQPKPVVPFGNRTSMSDQLWKISETAKERNLSQTNISRTVLYDPYQNQAVVAKPEPQKSPEKQDVLPSGPIFSQNVAGKKLQPPASFDPTSANFFPTVLALQIGQQSSSPVATAIEKCLQESSPDTYWSKKPYDHSTPLTTTAVEPKPAPQNFKGPFFTAGESVHGSDTKTTSSSASKKTYDEELKDWWTFGNKFARQEEFFESIMAAHKASNSNIMTSSPPAHLTPIGPPSRTSKKQEPAPFNRTTTRLLIPVLENLVSYVQGPVEKRRDYFSQWSQPPEWCIDRSEGGNNSFFDSDWGQPPARVGRDPRYQNRSWAAEQTPQMNRYASPGSHGSGGYGMSVAVGSGIDRRFNFAGRY